MNLLFNQILNHKEAAALPPLLESGGLPALVSGLSPVHRANLAAALHSTLGLPLFAVCADDTAAETFARDLNAMTGEEVTVLGMRDYVFYPAEAASRQAEQRRIAALFCLAKGESALTVASVSGLMQRTLPPEALLKTAFTISDGASMAPEDVEDALLRCGYRRSPQVEGPGQSRDPVSSRAAAASWTFSPRPTASPCASSSGATTSTPCPSSTCRASAAPTGSRPVRSCPPSKP